MIDRTELFSILSKMAIKYQMTGSRYICNPPPMDTDEDYIVLMNTTMIGKLIEAGFDLNTDPDRYDAMPDFFAMRLGEFNLVCTDSEEFYTLFVNATEESRAKNLMEKADRIALFRKHLYNEPEMTT